jgi:hypothetical protein
MSVTDEEIEAFLAMPCARIDESIECPDDPPPSGEVVYLDFPVKPGTVAPARVPLRFARPMGTWNPPPPFRWRR